MKRELNTAKSWLNFLTQHEDKLDEDSASAVLAF